MKTAVVILNWDRSAATMACATAVLKSTGVDYGLVLVDNGSPATCQAELLNWLSEHGPVQESMRDLESVTYEVPGPNGTACSHLALLLRKCNGGYAQGNNAGLRWGRSRGAVFAWILNNDTLVDPRAMAAMLMRAEAQSDIGMVGSCLVDSRRPDLIQCYGGGWWQRFTTRNIILGAGMPRESATRLHDQLARLQYIQGASVLYKLEALREIGDLCELYFLYHEDRDCATKLLSRGYSMCVAGDAIVFHEGGGTSGSAPKARDKTPLAGYHAARSLVLYVRRWHPRLLLWVLAVRSLYATLVVVAHPAIGAAMLRGLIAGLRADIHGNSA